MVQKALTTDMLRRPTVDDLLADAWLSAHREEVHAGALGGISWDSKSKFFCFFYSFILLCQDDYGGQPGAFFKGQFRLFRLGTCGYVGW